MSGFPAGSAYLFDMDGVVTQTAVVHAAAWKEMFDDFLHARARAQQPSSSRSTRVPSDAYGRQAPARRHRVLPRIPGHRTARGHAG